MVRRVLESHLRAFDPRRRRDRSLGTRLSGESILRQSSSDEILEFEACVY